MTVHSFTKVVAGRIKQAGGPRAGDHLIYQC